MKMLAGRCVERREVKGLKFGAATEVLSRTKDPNYCHLGDYNIRILRSSLQIPL
jgi:hypothetical protein